MAAAKPDGYTLLQVTITHAIAEGIYTGLPYQLLTSFAPVAATGATDYVLALNNAVPADTAAQFIAHAKSASQPVFSGTSGVNGPTDLASKLFAHSSGIRIEGVPYKGANEAITDLIGWRVQMSFIALPAALPLLKSKMVKGIGVTGLRRSAFAPELPTVDESGLKGFSASTWFGVVAPAGTPEAVLAKLHDAFSKALDDPATQEALVKGGIETQKTSRKQFADFMQTEVGRWKIIIEKTGVQKQSLSTP